MKIDLRLVQVLKGLQIAVTDLTPQLRLRDDLGMDSAEIIDMVCECECAYGVSIPDDGTVLSRLQRVGDVLDLVQACGGDLKTAEPAVVTAMDQAPGFTDRCVQTIEIAAPLEVVYAALFDVAAWPRHLPHVHAIDLTYDDGRYQEFRMSVASENEQLLHVRSIRNCRPNIIEFFQPEPPPYLRHHGGVWRFIATGSTSTRVVVTHVWNLSDRLGEFFPETNGRSGAQQVREVLTHHSNLALTRWRTVLETAHGLVEVGGVNVTEKITVDVPPEQLYDLYCDLGRWPQVLQDVVSAQVYYTDGYHQEFSMTVRRPTGEETVRGVRYCRGRELEMCQFTTPPMLSRMSGRWIFDGPPEGPTTLSAERSFALRDPDGDAERFAAQLRTFLRENLRAFSAAALDAHR